MFTLPLLSLGYRLLAFYLGKAMPKILRKSAMGFDAVMR